MPTAFIIGGATLVLVAVGVLVAALLMARARSQAPAKPTAQLSPAVPAPLPKEDDITETVSATPTPEDLADEPPSMDTGAVSARNTRDEPHTEPLGLAQPLEDDEEEEFEDAPTVLMGKGGMPEEMREMMAELLEEEKRG